MVVPKPLSAVLLVAVNPERASGGAEEGGRTCGLHVQGVSVLEHSSAAGCLEQGPDPGTEAELMGLYVPACDVDLEDDGCPWAGGGLEEKGLYCKESLQPGLGEVGGSFPRSLLEAPETC